MRNHLFFSSHFLRCCMCVWKFCYFPNNQRDDFKFRIHAASSNPQNINKRENNNFPTTTTNNSWNIRKTFCGWWWWWWRRKGGEWSKTESVCRRWKVVLCVYATEVKEIWKSLARWQRTTSERDSCISMHHTEKKVNKLRRWKINNFGELITISAGTGWLFAITHNLLKRKAPHLHHWQ